MLRLTETVPSPGTPRALPGASDDSAFFFWGFF